MELSDFLRRLAELVGSGEGLHHAFALHLAEQTELRMARITGARAMAIRPAATAGSGRDGSRPEIAEGKELLQQPDADSLQVRERLR